MNPARHVEARGHFRSKLRLVIAEIVEALENGKSIQNIHERPSRKADRVPNGSFAALVGVTSPL